ncbi:DNA recombination protein RmuC, partial [Klebsiella michiganensis]|uniref:DNA recombination protein RmuC n=1 Tax=Klebsiella michiganensis TaxID=1134687 RepID=UPI001E4149C7
GYEYQTQVSIETDNRARMQPDVIVRLPQGKDVVIDAKMTLVATPPNLVVNSELLREGLQGFSFFSVTPIGLVVLVLGVF